MASFDSAFRHDVSPVSGGWSDSASTVRHVVSGLTRGSRGMWIGIASQGVDGARGRWNAKYKALGMKHMAVVYQTSSDSFRKKMESDLTEFYGLVENGGHLDNKCEGGGGGHGSGPYVVYVAWA